MIFFLFYLAWFLKLCYSSSFEGCAELLLLFAIGLVFHRYRYFWNCRPFCSVWYFSRVFKIEAFYFVFSLVLLCLDNMEWKRIAVSLSIKKSQFNNFWTTLSCFLCGGCKLNMNILFLVTIVGGSTLLRIG